MSAIHTVDNPNQHVAAHGLSSVGEVLKHGWARFVAWRRTERAREEAYRNLRYMTARDFADLGVSRGQIEYHLRTSRRF